MTAATGALPVVLTPGFMDNALILSALASYLRRQGVAAYPLSPQPSNGTVGIDALAEQLADQIDTTLGPAQPFAFFGFSMGGLIGRYYLQRLGGAGRIRRLITLATPHRGSYTPRVLPRRPALVQMWPGSEFLDDLNADLTPLCDLEFTAYWTPLDLSVMPAQNCYLPELPQRRVWSPFHATLLLDPRVIRVVGQALAAPER
jgi:triacylglycerol lipase